jgi:hypothetical protein
VALTREELIMLRFLGVLLLLAAGVIGLGFYLGWFHFSKDSDGQKTNISITVDQDKIREDEKRAKEKVQGIGQQVKERTGAGAEKSKDNGPRP